MRINPIDPSIRTKPRERDNDDKYLAWLRKQRSAFSNKSPCIAAHFRTAKNSGTGIKPLFSAIPLTNSEHLEQHRIGQFAFAPREWWIGMVKKYQIRFMFTGGEIPQKYRI